MIHVKNITNEYSYQLSSLCDSSDTFKGTLRWSDKNLYMINIDPKITLVWLKILNSSIFTPKSGRES